MDCLSNWRILRSLCPFQKRLVAFAPPVQPHDPPAVQRIKSSSLSVLEQAAERYSQLEATARSSAPLLSAADCERECDALERIVDNHFHRLYPRHGLVNEVSLTQLLTHSDTSLRYYILVPEIVKRTMRNILLQVTDYFKIQTVIAVQETKL